MGTRFALGLFGLVISSQLALAQDWGLNQIVGYVDLAEKRLAEGDVNSARFNLNSARDMVPKASAEAKAHKGYGEVQQRIAKLDKAIASKEAGAAKTQEGTDKLDAAGDDEMNARIAMDNEKYELAAKYYKSCSQNLELAAAADPAATKGTSSHNTTYADLVTKCRDGLAEVGKLTSGEAKDAAKTEEGKLALENLPIAEKAWAAKKIESLEMAAAITAAGICAHRTSLLTSLYTKNRNPVWNGKKDKLGTQTIDEVNAKCRKFEMELKTKPTVGCGVHYVSVSQTRASIHDKWGPVKNADDMVYKAMACAEMPKKNNIRGQAAGFKARYEQQCGKDAIYIIQHDSWLEHPTQRQMSGECYKKGTIKIGS
jgi:hypothetical protein